MFSLTLRVENWNSECEEIWETHPDDKESYNLFTFLYESLDHTKSHSSGLGSEKESDFKIWTEQWRKSQYHFLFLGGGRGNYI